MSKNIPEGDPIFWRGDVAKILNISTLTVANREDAGKYPQPRRDLNNYRIYSLNDVLHLQHLTYGSIDTRPIMSVLYDKGWDDPKRLGQLMERAMKRREHE